MCVNKRGPEAEALSESWIGGQPKVDCSSGPLLVSIIGSPVQFWSDPLGSKYTEFGPSLLHRTTPFPPTSAILIRMRGMRRRSRYSTRLAEDIESLMTLSTYVWQAKRVLHIIIRHSIHAVKLCFNSFLWSFLWFQGRTCTFVRTCVRVPNICL